MIRTIYAIAFAILCCGISPAQDFVNEQSSTFIGEPVQPVPDPIPDYAGPSVADGISQMRSIADQISADREKIESLANKLTSGPGFRMPELPLGDPALERRVSALERRMDVVEEKLEALVTVKQSDGTTKTESVEIDTVSGYGKFEVPPGGKVVAINGVPIQRSSVSTTIYHAGTYMAEPIISQPRTVMIKPRIIPRAGTCTINPITGTVTCR